MLSTQLSPAASVTLRLLHVSRLLPLVLPCRLNRRQLLLQLLPVYRIGYGSCGSVYDSATNTTLSVRPLSPLPSAGWFSVPQPTAPLERSYTTAAFEALLPLQPPPLLISAMLPPPLPTQLLASSPPIL